MKNILFMMGAAALALSSCSQEEVISANNGKNDANLITFRVRSQKPSRAMELSTYNLDDFMVYGFKGCPDDGEEVIPYFLNGEPVKFTREEGGLLFTSATPYYYPTDGSWLYFAAYAPSSLTGFTIDKFGGLELKNFTINTDITKQLDLIFANGGSNLEPDEDDQELTFTHALTKVFISKVANDDVRYKYEIVGVKFGNITNTGDYVYRGEKAFDDEGRNGYFGTDGYIQDYTGYGHFWKPAEAQADEIEYIFDEPVVLDNDNTTQYLMSGDDTANLEGGKECFMLIPQKLSAKFVNEDGTLEAGKFEKGMTYIAFLVRITNLITNEVIYPYAIDEETGASKTDAISKEVNGVTYAWAAFPVSSLWVPGSFIDYFVDFSKGAGFVAPGADESIEFTPILGREIKFYEEVFDWTDGTEITVDQSGELGMDVGNADDPFGED